ncbi:MAG: type I restriction-modification system subunit M [Erysipelotrichaceae bacterium]|nr:type I restriction-modification system subunit M [Erysipelotrichaceae bacterium]
MAVEDVKSTLWNMANQLRGNMGADEYKNYILAFMFYKYLSQKQEDYLLENEMIEVKDGQTFDQAFQEQTSGEELDELVKYLTTRNGYAIEPQYTWSNIVRKVTDNEIIPSDFQDMFSAFYKNASLNEDASKDFKNVFSDVNLGDSRLGTTTIDRAKSLINIVNLVDGIQYKDENGKDVLGEIYEYLIGQFAANAGKKGGEFYTPHEVSMILAGIVTSGQEESNKAFKVFDPTCGSGSLLLTVGNALPGGNRPGAIKYYGQELNTSTYNLCRMNLMMHGVGFREMNLRNANTLGPDWPDGIVDGLDHPDNTFDAVVANPPYSAKWNPGEEMMKDKRFKDYGKLAPKSKADYAFVLDGLYHLGNEGTMAVVLPHGVLFRGSAEEAIRKALIEKGQIEAVIGLPANLFYGTSIPTVIMVLKKNRTSKDIFFIDASQEFLKSKAKNTLTSENVEKILETYKNRKDVDRYAHLATIEEIRENDYNLNIPRYVDTSEEAEEIDLDALLKELDDIDAQIAEAQNEIDDKLRILGVLK